MVMTTLFQHGQIKLDDIPTRHDVRIDLFDALNEATQKTWFIRIGFQPVRVGGLGGTEYQGFFLSQAAAARYQRYGQDTILGHIGLDVKGE